MIRAWLPSVLAFASVTLALWLGLGGCSTSDKAGTVRTIQSSFDPWSAEPTTAERCPHAGNLCLLAASLTEAERAASLARLDAWLSAYKLPGLRAYVFPFRAGQPWVSYRNADLGLVRLTYYRPGDDPSRLGLEDPAWEISRLYWRADDPPPLGIGPVVLPAGDEALRALALSLGGAP